MRNERRDLRSETRGMNQFVPKCGLSLIRRCEDEVVFHREVSPIPLPVLGGGVAI
tara:strand:- start:258 stop:422 length:165 start_codon:yes stop_codon:yes gene_type:complete